MKQYPLHQFESQVQSALFLSFPMLKLLFPRIIMARHCDLQKLWPKFGTAIWSFILRSSVQVFNFLLKDDPKLRGTTPKGILSEHVHHRSQNLGELRPCCISPRTTTERVCFFYNFLLLFCFSDYPHQSSPFLANIFRVTNTNNIRLLRPIDV